MKLYKQTESYTLYEGNMLDMLKVLKPNSIDSIVTDPPYGLTSIVKRFGKENSAPAKTDGNDGSFARLSKGFMGKVWDGSGVEYNVDAWKNCYTVLKPGGYLLAFGGSRTFYRIACAIEDAGFEIRDTIMWLYGSGFPKSLNIGLAIDKKNGVESKIVGYESGTMPNFRDVGKKQKEISGMDKLTFGQIENSERKEQPIYEAQNEWSGWGTALKPSFEPIIIARKPCEGSCIDNVLCYGTGGINIDECRIPLEDGYTFKETNRRSRTNAVFTNDTSGFKSETNHIASADPKGRFPANTILTYDETDYDEVCSGFPNSGSGNGGSPFVYAGREYNNKDTSMFNGDKPKSPSSYNDLDSASRYFYCAKASKKDRDEGCTGLEEGRFVPVVRKNTHPTVKPTELMQYLVRLVTPKGGTVLDPFMGSGSTGKATMFENRERNAKYKFVGIELTEEYLPICEARINFAVNYTIDASDMIVSNDVHVMQSDKKILW